MRWSFAIGQHVIPLRKPASDLALQNRLAIFRGQPLAVNDPDAAQSFSARVQQKIAERIVRFVDRHSVQIDNGLHDPVAAAKLDEYVGPQARAQKRLLALDLEPDVPRAW